MKKQQQQQHSMGFTRTHLIVFLSLTVVFLFGTHLYYQRASNEGNIHARSDELTETLLKLVHQRNNLSRALNLKQQKIGQMECEVRMEILLVWSFCDHVKFIEEKQQLLVFG